MTSQSSSLYTLFSRFIPLLAVFSVLAAANVQAANTRYAVATGDWNSTATWAATSGGASGASVPVAGDTANVTGAFTVTISDAEACATLNVTTSSSAKLEVQTNGTLTVSGTTTVNNSDTITVDIGGTLSLATATVTSGAIDNNGTTTISGNLTGAGSLVQGSSASLRLGGTSTITTLNATASGNTVNFTGAAQTVKATSYQNLSFSGSGAKTVSATTSAVNVTMSGSATVGSILNGLQNISGNISLSGSAQFTVGANLNNSSGGGSTIDGNVSLSGISQYSIGSNSSNIISGNVTVGDGTTFTDGAAQLIVTGTTTVGAGSSGTLTINNSTGGTRFFTGAVTVNNGGLFHETAATALTFGGDVIINSGGTLAETGAAVIGIAGNLTNSGTYTASVTGTHTFSGTSKTFSGSVSIPRVSITGSYDNQGTLTVSTVLSGAGSLINDTNATLNAGGSGSSSVGVATLTATAAGNTVNYSGAGQTVKATTYNNLTLSGSGTKTLAGGVTAGGTLTIADGCALDSTAGTMTCGSGVVDNMTALVLQNLNSTPVITVAGSLTVNGTNTITISSANGLNTGSTYPLVRYGTLAGGGFANFSLSLPGSVTGTLTNDTSNLWIALNVTDGSPVTSQTNITYSVSGNTLTLSWPAAQLGWFLQSQTNSLNTGISTNWADVPGSDGTNNAAITIDPANPAVFFRLSSSP